MRALCDHSRNLDDEQLLALKKNGGVVQVVAFTGYLKKAVPDSPERTAAMEELRKEFNLPSRGGGASGGGAGAPPAAGAPAGAPAGARGGGRGGALAALDSAQRAKYQARLAEVNAKYPAAARANVKDLADHIDYAVKLIGIDHVGISSDFDGGGGIDGYNGAADAFNVTLELVRRGYTEVQITKLWGGNLLRVMHDVEQVAKRLQQQTKS
jgi:membrane dipeptidase